MTERLATRSSRAGWAAVVALALPAVASCAASASGEAAANGAPRTAPALAEAVSLPHDSGAELIDQALAQPTGSVTREVRVTSPSLTVRATISLEWDRGGGRHHAAVVGSGDVADTATARDMIAALERSYGAGTADLDANEVSDSLTLMQATLEVLAADPAASIEIGSQGELVLIARSTVNGEVITDDRWTFS